MDYEVNAIVKNKTWELTYFPKDEKLIGVKRVYKSQCFMGNPSIYIYDSIRFGKWM